MPQFFTLSSYTFFLAVVIAFTSCQNEEPFQADIDPELTLAAGSTVIEMMKRVTSNDGSYDNIVDGASCIGIQFPYTVTVNGSEVNIEAREDLQKIEALLDAAYNGEHIIEIAFPITMTLADYTEVTVNSKEVMHDYVQQCIEGGDDNDIECIDVTYPVSLFTFDTNLQETGSLVVNHDKELRRFLAGLAETELISIEFPLSFEMFDATGATVSNNTELAATIERAIEICDEDDDDDYNDDDFTEESLDSLLVLCPWSVQILERTDADGLEQYQNDLLTFKENGQVSLDDGLGLADEGSWAITVSDFKVYLTLEFKDANAFNGTLYTYEIGEGTIKLDGGEFDEIILEQQCGYP